MEVTIAVGDWPFAKFIKDDLLYDFKFRAWRKPSEGFLGVNIVNARPDVIILDSHQLFGFGVQTVLGAFGPDFSSFVVTSLVEALEKLSQKTSVKLAFVDLTAPGVAGPATIQFLRSRYPQLKVIATCGDASRNLVFECLVQGAYGCILKTQSGSEILNAVRVVLSGGVYVPVAVVEAAARGTDALVFNMVDHVDLIGNVTGVAGRGESVPNAQLSRQQQAVLRLLIRGLSNKAIARELQLAEGTVKVHINGVFKALKVNSRVQAVVRSVEFHKSDRLTKLGTDVVGDKPGPNTDASFPVI